MRPDQATNETATGQIFTNGDKVMNRNQVNLATFKEPMSLDDFVERVLTERPDLVDGVNRGMLSMTLFGQNLCSRCQAAPPAAGNSRLDPLGAECAACRAVADRREAPRQAHPFGSQPVVTFRTCGAPLGPAVESLRGSGVAGSEMWVDEAAGEITVLKAAVDRIAVPLPEPHVHVQAREASDWLPIETAPWDGTVVDLWVTNERLDGARIASGLGRPVRRRLRGLRECGFFFDRDCWRSDADRHYVHKPRGEPTHWMPVPGEPGVRTSPVRERDECQHVRFNEADYRAMSAPDMLAAVGTDAVKWTDAFLQTFPAGCDDWATIVGWFANAIEAGRQAGLSAKPLPADEPPAPAAPIPATAFAPRADALRFGTVAAGMSGEGE